MIDARIQEQRSAKCGRRTAPALFAPVNHVLTSNLLIL